MTNRTKQRVFIFGAMLAPMAIVQAGRYLVGGDGPSAASASVSVVEPTAMETPTAMPVAAKWTEAQQRAWTHLKSLSKNNTRLDSPMQTVAAAPVTAQAAMPVAPAHAAPLPVAAPKVALTTILKGTQGTMAVINGRVYGQGAEVAAGWRISAIDPEQLRVELTGPGGAKSVVERGR